jgi:ankyrin repeat protein
MFRLRDDTLLAYAYRAWDHHTRQCYHYEPVMAASSDLILNCKSFPLLNPRQVDFGGPLHVAAYYGFDHLIPPAARLQSPNAQTTWHKCSPLLLAADRGHPACAKALLSLPGIDVNLSDISGSNALMRSVGRPECLQLLAQAPGIDINAGDQDDRTALIHAVWSFHLNCGATELLLGLPGVDINKGDKVGWTPLMHAAHLGRKEATKQLLASPGIDVNAVSALTGDYRAMVGRFYFSKQGYHKHTWTALMIAAREGHIDIVKQLLSAPGINVKAVSEPSGHTALSYASAEGHREIVELLITSTRP